MEQRFKVIAVDNFARDYISDFLITDFPMNQQCASEIADVLNNHYSGPDSFIFFKSVKYSYTLNDGGD